MAETLHGPRFCGRGEFGADEEGRDSVSRYLSSPSLGADLPQPLRLLPAPPGTLDQSVPHPALQMSWLSQVLALFPGLVDARFYSISYHHHHLSYLPFFGRGESRRSPWG